MPVTGVRVEGARELRAAIKRAETAGLPKQLAAAYKSGSDVVAARALPNVPVRTGRLKGSVRALGSQTRGQVKAGTASVDYAAAIHWGRKRGNVWHHKMGRNPIKGRPFLWNAARDSTREVVDKFEAAIGRLLKEIVN